MSAWTGGEVARLIELASSGMLLKRIAKILGRTLSAIKGQLRRQGVRRRPEFPYSRGIFVALVRRHWARGRDDVEIADRLGVSPNAVFIARRKLGLSPVHDRHATAVLGGAANAARWL
jgi:DNA-binding CsgD family transcriptional regulator